MKDKILSINSYFLPGGEYIKSWWRTKPYLIVKVITHQGLIGWGECNLLTFRENAIISNLKSITEFIVGRSSANIKELKKIMYNEFCEKRPSLECYSAFAGIEIALWDILGKSLSIPIYSLFGGSYHSSMEIYANIYTPYEQTVESYVKMAIEQVNNGHKTLKLYPFLNNSSIDNGVKIIEAIRYELGNEIGLAVDLWRKSSPTETILISKAIEPYNILWIEDPFPPYNPENFIFVKNKISQPLMTGETLPSINEFSQFISNRSIDLINPDICLSGFLEIQSIANLAENFQIQLSPHNSNSMALGLSAAANIAASIPNLGMIEYFPLFEKLLDDYCEGRLPVRSGRISLPYKSGLGIIFDEKKLAKFKVK